MEELAQLEKRLTSADGAKSINDITRFYEVCETGDLRTVAAALQAIPRILTHFRRRCIVGVDNSDDSVTALSDWLLKHGDAYSATLVQLAGSKAPKAQVCAIRLAMAWLQKEAEEIRSAAGGAGTLAVPPPPETRVQALVTALLLSEHWGDHVAACLVDEFVAKYVDVRHMVLSHLRNSLEQVCRAELPCVGEAAEPLTKRQRRMLPFVDAMLSKKVKQEDVFTRAVALLKATPPPSNANPAAQQDEGEPVADMLAPCGRAAGPMVRSQRKTFQEAWKNLLGMQIPLNQWLPLLQYLPTHVMPHLSTPLMLADFYLRAFHSATREIGVRSLSGLLVLLTQHGLGDPEKMDSAFGGFYTQLYSLFTRETLEMRQRARFQRLLAAALTSTLMPQRFAAVFAKKCMCIAVACSEPGTTMWLLALAYSLVQKCHSHCKFLLHQPEGAEAALADGGGAEKDPFDVTAPFELAQEQVLKSSMWEVQLLRRHHTPSVAMLARLFLRPFFNVTARTLEPDMFLNQDVAQLYKQALKSSDRLTTRWKAKGKDVPLAYAVQDDDETACVAGWAAALSTKSRRVGIGIE